MNNTVFRIFAIWFAISTMLWAQGSIYKKDVGNGVTHYYRNAPEDGRAHWFSTAEKLLNVVFQYKTELPFNRSVAFLVGVSDYKHLKPLPFVENDLEDMKNFLLGDGGFDEVFVVKNAAVNRDLIEDWIQNKFFPPSGVHSPYRLEKKDRFLFYYAGHGYDRGGDTGYMQFAGAKANIVVRNQVMRMKPFQSLCREIPSEHLLFIFDCCNAGLGFAPVARSSDDYRLLVATMSKSGSRTIITAGTGSEKTFEVKDRRGKGNGVFTRAFLNAVQSGGADTHKDGFITIDEIMARVKSEIAAFSANKSQTLTPRSWPVDVNRYKGTFVFINPKSGSIDYTPAQQEALHITARRGGPPVEYGQLQVIALADGELYVDGRRYQQIAAYQGVTLLLQTGRRKIELRSNGKNYSETRNLRRGTDNVALTLGPESEPTPPPVINTRTDEPYNNLFSPDKFAKIEAGSFTMGSNSGENDEKPPHTVRISKAFYLGKTEVTQKQWRAVMGTTVAQQRDKANSEWPLRGEGDDYPMYYVSREEAQEFIRRLNQKYGRNIFRLPTEAEWEYACRAGSSGDYAGSLDAMGWYSKNANSSTQPVGKKLANNWGLHDMHGNVWEWCSDWYDRSYYSSSPAADPQGPAPGTSRVLRGGGWHDTARNCRSANRSGNSPGGRFHDAGFRLLRTAY